MSEILLETHGLTKQFGRYKAVNRLDMHIRRGAVYGFIGRNGAGKTHLFENDLWSVPTQR